MDTRLLCYAAPILSPEARWLLLQWSRSPGLDQPVFCPRAELYRLLGIPPQHARPALGLLEKHGYVVGEPFSRGRGRPTTRYIVSPRFRSELEKLTNPATAHHPEIESLCIQAIHTRTANATNSQNLLSGVQRANRLAPATYYLLAVLLAHAEIPGIVRNLSYWQLQAITGMTKARLISQLSKLKRVGLIARHEPGVLRNREAIRMRSVYTLNLCHPFLLGKDSIGLTAIFSSSTKPGNVTFLSGFYDAALVAITLAKHTTEILTKIDATSSSDESRAVPATMQERSRLSARRRKAYLKLDHDAHSLLPQIQPTQTAAEDFLKAHSLGMGPILKDHIYAYVTMLLSNHWADLERVRGKRHEPICDVMHAIRRDCSALATTENPENSPHSDSDFFALVYFLAHHVAVELQHTLKSLDQFAECDFSTAIFQIEPSNHQNDERWVVRAYFRSSDGVTYLGNGAVTLPSVALSLPEELEVLGIE